jgi:hypothetical protein
MGLKWCDPPGYWASGDEPPDLCDPTGIQIREDRPTWVPTGQKAALENGKTYYLKCRPGGPCEALVEEDPDVAGPWDVVGEVSVPEDVPAGLYDVYCRTGGGQKCQVALRPDG